MNQSPINSIDQDLDTSQSSFNQDWEKKYDISIEILKDEYQTCLTRLKDVDEKSNKYLVIISIFFTGFFTVLASSLIDKLSFSTKNLTLANLISYIFLITLVISIVLGGIVVRDVLKTFRLSETRRMPNISKTLNDTANDTNIHYKGLLITFYQEMIDVISVSIEKKQTYIKNVSLNIEKLILSTFISLFILIILKLIG